MSSVIASPPSIWLRQPASLISALALLCICAFGCPAKEAPAPSRDPHVHNYGDTDQSCTRWTDECRTCGRAADRAPACSNIGVACQPKKVRCLQRQEADTSHAQENTARLIAECDRLAGSDQDPQRPKSVPGVPLGQVDADAALAACSAATQAAPTDGRVLFQLGRAFDAAGQYNRAREAYELADQLGYSLAAINLAIQLKNAQGGNADLDRARRLYEKAAAAGHPRAMLSLAVLYENGTGVTKDAARAQRLYDQAVRGFHRLAANGSASAMTALGLLYENGRGVSKDAGEAERWYSLAARAGDKSGADNLRKLRLARQAPTNSSPPVVLSVRDLLERNGLFGTFADDCTSDPSDDNPYITHYVIDAEHVQRDMVKGPGAPTYIGIVDQIQQLSADEVAMSVSIFESTVAAMQGQRYRLVTRVDGQERVRLMKSEPQSGPYAGRKDIIGGRERGGRAETQWLTKCR